MSNYSQQAPRISINEHKRNIKQRKFNDKMDRVMIIVGCFVCGAVMMGFLLELTN